VSAFCPTNTIRATSESELQRNDADIELKETGRWATTFTRIQCWSALAVRSLGPPTSMCFRLAVCTVSYFDLK
jgi:hypothetical protein